MFYEVSGYCSQGSDHHRHYCCLLFPKSFYFDFQVLVLSDLFHFFLIDSAISWYCHINQPHLLLFNHCYIGFVMSQMFVCLNFKVPENFDFFILQHFIDIVFPPFFGCRSKPNSIDISLLNILTVLSSDSSSAVDFPYSSRSSI